MTVVCYPSPGKRKGRMICEAFAKGAGGQVGTGKERGLYPGSAFFYGWTPYTRPLITDCAGQDRTWFYADNAYFGGLNNFFRVTRDDWMLDGTVGEIEGSGWERRDRLGINLKSWQTGGGHIVIVTQSHHYYEERLAMTRYAWTRDVVEALREHTDRRIAIHDKPTGAALKRAGAGHATFADDLADAWAVVSHTSSALVEALIAGVPVFPLGRSMVGAGDVNDLDRIERPRYNVDRETLLANLANGQWTLDEIRDGTCWRMLNKAS